MKEKIKASDELSHFRDSLFLWGDEPWLNQFLDLVAKMFNSLNINRDSPQIGMTVAKNKELNINIGQRWVIRPRGEENIGLILPLGAREGDLGCQLIGYFNKSHHPDAKWVNYEWATGTEFPQQLYTQWESACMDELNRTKKSAYRKFHSDWFFDATMDKEFRKDIFSGIEREINNSNMETSSGNIRSKAIQWYIDRYGKKDSAIYASKLYKPEESWTKDYVWFVQIPKQVLSETDFVHVLCQDVIGGDHFFHLKIPVDFFAKNKEKFDQVKNSLALYFSPKAENFFTEIRGKGNVSFKSFLQNY